MADETKQLLVRIQATTELLRQQMIAAENSVEKSTRAMQNDLDKIDRKFVALNKAGGVLAGGMKLAAGAIVGFIASIGVGTLVEATKRALDYAGSLGEAAAAVGVGTKFLQEFRFAVEQNGGSIEGADNALTKFNVTLGRAFSGNKAAAGAVAALGIDMKALSAASDSERFLLVAEAISKIEDPAKRAAAAQTLFGKTFKEIAPLLQQGRKGFEDCAEEARNFGLILSSEQIQSADATADKIQKLNRALEAKIAGAVAQNAEGIGILVNALVDLAGAAANAFANYSRFRSLQGLKSPDATTRSESAASLLKSHDGRNELLGLIDDRLKENSRQVAAGTVVTSRSSSMFGAFRRERPATAAERAAQDAEFRRLNSTRNKILGLDRAGYTGTDNRAPSDLQVGRGDGSFTPAAGRGSRTARAAKKDADDAIPSLEKFLQLYQRIETDLSDRPSDKPSVAFDGPDGASQIEAMVGAADDRLDAQLENNRRIADDYRDRLENATSFAADTFQTLFDRGVDGIWENFERLGERVIAEVAAKMLISFIATGKVGDVGSIFSTVLGGIFGFANGGEPPVGRPSLVGERGPELFIPRVPGTVVSNDNLRGMGGSTVQNITINAPGATAETTAAMRREIRAAAPSLISQSKRETVQSAGRRRL